VSCTLVVVASLRIVWGAAVGVTDALGLGLVQPDKGTRRAAINIDIMSNLTAVLFDIITSW
jgi:hypothetical protein